MALGPATAAEFGGLLSPHTDPDRSFSVSLNQSSSLHATVKSFWLDPGISQTARCGQSCELEIEEVVGIADSDSRKLDDDISGSFGAESIAQVKSMIRTSSEQTVTLSSSRSVRRKFTFESDSCGAKRIKLFQKALLIDLIFERRTFWGRKRVTRCQVVERTQEFDAHIDVDEWHEPCRCNKNDVRPILGLLRLAWGKVSVLTPYSRSAGNFRTEIGDFSFTKDPKQLGRDARLRIPSHAVHEMFRYLSRTNEDHVNCSIELLDLESVSPAWQSSEAQEMDVGEAVSTISTAGSYTALDSGSVAEEQSRSMARPIEGA